MQLLEVNGKLSSSKKTKHIKAIFFFVKDKVDGGLVKITDCPTEYMLADVNSKPLQGTLFRVMYDKLMSCGVDYKDNFWKKTRTQLQLPSSKSVCTAYEAPPKFMCTTHRSVFGKCNLVIWRHRFLAETIPWRDVAGRRALRTGQIGWDKNRTADWQRASRGNNDG